MRKYGFISAALVLISATVIVVLQGVQIHSTDASSAQINARVNDVGSVQPMSGVQIYKGDGYSVEIPADFIYTRWTGLGTSYETWHSRDDTHLIIIQSETDSPQSKIRGTEEANITFYKRSKSPVPAVYPEIRGSKSSEMFEKPLPPPEFYGVYLFVNASNGKIYEIDGIAFSPAAQGSAKRIVQSFRLGSD